jgi:hypothetical protein
LRRVRDWEVGFDRIGGFGTSMSTNLLGNGTSVFTGVMIERMSSRTGVGESWGSFTIGLGIMILGILVLRIQKVFESFRFVPSILQYKSSMPYLLRATACFPYADHLIF